MSEIIAVRGATTIECDCKEEIVSKTVELMKKLIEANGIGEKTHCVSIIISTTQDIRSFYPARALRESGLIDAPLFSCAEPDIEGALPLCIRVMLTLDGNDSNRSKHVYLHGAQTLRPDLK